MTQSRGRYIHSRTRGNQIRDLLQAVFVAELVSPGNCLWIVSPWITDIPIIDNRTNAFMALEPEWGRTYIRLSQITAKLLESGTTIHIATRPSSDPHGFAATLQDQISERGLGLLKIHMVDELHEKGILGDSFYLAGSMNFTFSGITLNEESVHFHTDPQVVSENRVTFRNRWGAELP